MSAETYWGGLGRRRTRRQVVWGGAGLGLAALGGAACATTAVAPTAPAIAPPPAAAPAAPAAPTALPTPPGGTPKLGGVFRYGVAGETNSQDPHQTTST